MKKWLGALLFTLLVAGWGVAQDDTGLPLKAEMTGLFTGGIRNLYLSADPSVVWKPGVFAAGAGLEVIVGMTQFDIYVHPYLRSEIGWVHLDAGYVLPVVRPLTGTGLKGMNVGIAASPRPFELGYGTFGFELAFDFNIAAAQSVYDSSGTYPEGTRILIAAIGSGRIGLGVTYGFEL